MPTRKQDVAVEIFANVRIDLHDRLECGVLASACLLANEVGLRQYLWAVEGLTANGDDVAIWMLTVLLLVRALRRLFHFCIEVQGDVAELLLDIKTNLVLGCCSVSVALLCKDFMTYSVRSRQRDPLQNGMRQNIALIDGDRFSFAVGGKNHLANWWSSNGS